MVDPQNSDAALHDQIYAVALGLSGIPVFFQTIGIGAEIPILSHVIQSDLFLYLSASDADATFLG